MRSSNCIFGLFLAFATISFCKDDAVLSLADNMSINDLSVFVQSFRRFSALGRMYLFFYNPPNEKVFELADAFDIEIVLVSNRTLSNLCATGRRWVNFRDWFVPRKDDFSRILFSDSRDVVFQQDPFDIVGETDVLYVAQEGEVIEQVEINQKWLLKLYGAAVAQKLSRKAVLCSGTTLASANMAAVYLEKMSHEIIKHEELDDIGVDQGIHNYLVYGEHFGAYKALDMQYGSIMTLQEAQEFRVDAFGRVLNGNGDVAAIVHQYNRYLPLSFRYRSMYPFLPQPLRTMRNKKSQEHSKKALQYAQNNQWTLAEKELQRGHTSFDTLSIMGVVKGKLGKLEEAEDAHQAAMLSTGFCEMAWINYGSYLFDQKRYQESQDIFLEVLDRNPQSSIAQTQLKLTKEKLKK